MINADPLTGTRQMFSDFFKKQNLFKNIKNLTFKLGKRNEKVKKKSSKNCLSYLSEQIDGFRSCKAIHLGKKTPKNHSNFYLFFQEIPVSISITVF